MEFLREAVGPLRDLVLVGAGQRVLILRSAGPRRDLDVLHALERRADLRDVGRIGLEPLQDLLRVGCGAYRAASARS